VSTVEVAVAVDTHSNLKHFQLTACTL